MRRREGEREGVKHQCGLPLTCPLLGIWPATQACALTGNQTSDTLVLRLVLSPRSHTNQGIFVEPWRLDNSHSIEDKGTLEGK